MNQTRNKQHDTLSGKLAETRENIADMGHLAKEAVQEKITELRDRATERYAEGKERLEDFGESLVNRVRTAPMKSVLIAAGVGLALGFFWRRR